jgi:hypothetical protein
MTAPNEFSDAFTEETIRPAIDGNGQDHERPPESGNDGPWEYPLSESNGNGRDSSGAKKLQRSPVITLDDWLKRELPPPDFLLGHWLTTTTRALLFAPTGIGKTLWGVGAAVGASAGVGFLHWQGRRPARCLYIDGEMARRLLKQRLVDEVQRSGLQPKGMHILSHEDVSNFAPLNTPQGQAQIEHVIKLIGDVDLIVFDNIMCLILGDMKDEEGWRQTMPWLHSLTRRRIGQLWLHHTGHDETRGYGTKTREWQMDTVISLETIERPDTDVSFQLGFRKARERTPATREDFAEKRVALVNDQWKYLAANGGAGHGHVPPLALKFLEALHNAIAGSDAKMYGRPAATVEHWRAGCIKAGLIDSKDKPNSQRALFSKYKLSLISANRIACNDTMAWLP